MSGLGKESYTIAPSGGKDIPDFIDLDDLFADFEMPSDVNGSSSEMPSDFNDSSFTGDNLSNTFNEDSNCKKITTFTDHNPILIPPTMPKVQQNLTTKNDSHEQTNQTIIKTSSKNKFSYANTDAGYDDIDSWNDKMTSDSTEAPKILTELQKVERRERNREHAKRSRIRKRVLLDTLQEQLADLRSENAKLRRTVIAKIPHKATKILEDCTTEESMLLSGDSNSTVLLSASNEIVKMPHQLRQHARILMEPDFRLIQALMTSQQNFVLSDPSLPDNPIVYCSEGFCKLTGYKRQDVLGRNCRFLQGPGTDQEAVNIIRKAVNEGRDVSVCLLNYKADGSHFWNQFFVAALRDSDGSIVNFVGVQCEVNYHLVDIKERVKKLKIPE